MHRNHEARAEIEKATESVFGAGVNAAEVVGTIGADGKKCDLGGEAAAYLGEALKKCRVSRVIDRMALAAEDIAAESAISVVEKLRAPML